MTKQQPPQEFSPADCSRTQDVLFTILDAKASSDTEIKQLLTVEEHLLLTTHLTACVRCQAYQQTMTHLIGSLDDLEEVALPAGLADRIMAQLPDEASQPVPATAMSAAGMAVSSRKLGLKQYASLAAAILLVAVTVPTLMQVFTSPPSSTSDASSVARQLEAYTHDDAAIHDEQQVAMNINQTTAPVAENDGRFGADNAHPNASKLLSPGPVHADNAFSAASKAERSAPANHPPSASAEPGKQTGDSSTRGGYPQPDGYQVNSTELASATPQMMTQYLSEVGASAERDDVYYDPVSALVGF